MHDSAEWYGNFGILRGRFAAGVKACVLERVPNTPKDWLEGY